MYFFVTPLTRCNHERSLDEATPSNKQRSTTRSQSSKRYGQWPAHHTCSAMEYCEGNTGLGVKCMHHISSAPCTLHSTIFNGFLSVFFCLVLE